MVVWIQLQKTIHLKIFMKLNNCCIPITDVNGVLVIIIIIEKTT